jgi:hypothetical protein
MEEKIVMLSQSRRGGEVKGKSLSGSGIILIKQVTLFGKAHYRIKRRLIEDETKILSNGA